MQLRDKYKALEKHRIRIKQEIKECEDLHCREELIVVAEEITKRQFRILKKLERGTDETLRENTETTKG